MDKYQLRQCLTMENKLLLDKFLKGKNKEDFVFSYVH